MRDGLEGFVEDAYVPPQCFFAVYVRWRADFFGNPVEWHLFAVEQTILVLKVMHGGIIPCQCGGAAVGGDWTRKVIALILCGNPAAPFAGPGSKGVRLWSVCPFPNRPVLRDQDGPAIPA